MMNSYLMDGVWNIQSKNIYNRVSKKCALKAKIAYILGLKAYSKDVYDSWPSHTNTENRYGGMDNTENSVYSAQFGQGANLGGLLGLCYENGYISVTNTQTRKCIAEKRIKRNVVYDISWVPNKPEIVSASTQFGVDKWTIVEGNDGLTNTGKYIGHRKSVTTIDVNPWEPVTFASGSRDGNIIIWDSRCQPKQRATTIFGAHNSESNRRLNKKSQRNANVGKLKYVGQNILASAGTSDGCIKFWDIRNICSRPRNIFKYPGESSCKGYTSLLFSANQNMLYVSCRDSKIYGYNISYPHPSPVKTFYGGNIASYFVKACLSPCGSYLLCGSNEDAFIWATENMNNSFQSEPILPIGKLKAHSDEVTSIAWSNDGLDTVVTLADDFKCYMFNVKQTDPSAEKNPDLVGHADPFHDIRLDKPILNVKSDQSYYIRPTMECSITEGHTCPFPSSCLRFRNPSDQFRRKTRLNHNVSSILSGVDAQSRSCATDNNQPEQLRYTVKRDSDTNSNSYVPSHTALSSPSCSFVTQATTPRNCGTRPSCKSPRTSGSQSSMSNWILALTKAAEHLTEDSSADRNTTANYNDCNMSTPDSAARNTESMLSKPDSTRKKVGSKKRLSDYLVNNQENLLRESYKEVRSPINNILTLSENVGKSAAKMPLCEDIKDADDMEGIKPFDGTKLSHLMGGSSHSGFDITPVKNVIGCQSGKLLKSPLADLPNYVVDGISPHRRPEKPVNKKRKEDWLTTLSDSKKKKLLKLSTIDEENTPRKKY